VSRTGTETAKLEATTITSGYNSQILACSVS
jgi:hypothetical protein